MPVFGVEQIEEPQAASQYFNKHVAAVGIGAASSKLIISYIPIVFFIVRRRHYIHIKPYDSVVTNCILVVKNAFQSWHEYKKNQCAIDEGHTNSGRSTSLNNLHSSTEEESIRIDERPSEFLDFTKVVNDGKFSDRIVEDVKSLRRLLIVFSLLIPYWFIYDQVRSIIF
jgi:hypothetical protein